MHAMGRCVVCLFGNDYGDGWLSVNVSAVHVNESNNLPHISVVDLVGEEQTNLYLFSLVCCCMYTQNESISEKRW